MPLTCDLYLYLFPNARELIKIPKLDNDTAMDYAKRWFNHGTLNDYIIVLSGDHPWYDEPDEIIEKDLAWLDDILSKKGTI